MKLILIISIFLINFIFTFQNDIYWNQTQILIANDGKESDKFGSVVKIKGNISVIGAPFAQIGNNSLQGKAYIYENNGTFWNLFQILIANDGEADDHFGFSVSISNDHKYILISSPFATIGNNYEQGKVYIYENNGTNWNQKQILIANDGEEDEEFGKSISISNDFALIGSPYANVGNNGYQGKVYIFQNNGTFYNLKQILIANDGKEYHEFGSSVAISNDSSFLFISALQANVGNNSNQGKVYIFQNDGIIWNQYQILIANDGKSSDRFGFSISISSDSSFIVVGVPYAKIGDNSLQGKAYIFQNNGTFWNQKEILIANDGETNDEFGFDVSISENYCLIGSPNSNFGDIFEQGKVYIFQNNGTIWNLFQILIASDGKEDDRFGSSISISGNYSLIGSPYSSFGDNYYQGKAYFFDLYSKPKPKPKPNSNSNSNSKTIYLIIIPILVILIGIILTIFFIRRKKIQIQIQIQYQKPEEIIMNNPLFSDDDDKEF